MLQHIAINYPPFAEANSPPFSPERSFVLAIFPFVLTYSNLLSPTSQRLAVRPFSPERETFEPLPLSIQIHSVKLRCLFSPRYLYLRQKMYIYYFMLYLAESLTGRSYTEGKLLRYFPLWRERVKVTNFVCCRQIPMGFGTV